MAKGNGNRRGRGMAAVWYTALQAAVGAIAPGSKSRIKFQIKGGLTNADTADEGRDGLPWKMRILEASEGGGPRRLRRGLSCRRAGRAARRGQGLPEGRLRPRPLQPRVARRGVLQVSVRRRRAREDARTGRDGLGLLRRNGSCGRRIRPRERIAGIIPSQDARQCNRRREGVAAQSVRKARHCACEGTGGAATPPSPASRHQAGECDLCRRGARPFGHRACRRGNSRRLHGRNAWRRQVLEDA